MSRVRADLVGVVYVPGAGGVPVALAAGDDVPDGVTLGDHLLEQGDVEGAEAQEPPRSGKGSGKEEWSRYAAALGVEYDQDASRDEIVAAVDAARSEG